jgi:pSer/pThr/pTyr-binding forkhead associated (FHA) protein
VADPAQRFLEYVFLALLYLFFLRVVRAVWVELREPRLVPAPPGPSGSPPPATRAATGTPKGRNVPRELAVISPEQAKGQAFPLGDEISIGRATGCAVALPTDTFVSQVHARVFRRGDEYWVEDLGSTNGTLVNGRKLTGPAPLRKGDRLQVGRTVLELRK